MVSDVQSLLTDTKAEVRSVLSHHGISNFVIKPVKRDYAFEMACIPRGKQWVLKVRLPSTAPTLPLGLTGAISLDMCIWLDQNEACMIVSRTIKQLFLTQTYQNQCPNDTVTLQVRVQN